MIAKNATTIWERWDYDRRDPGMNSEALLIQSGNLNAWFYQTLAGINYDPACPGFKHIILRPRPAGDLTWVKAHHDSLYGRIVSNWKLAGGKFVLEIAIPPNTTATVHVPARAGESITESDNPAATSPGVKMLCRGNGEAIFEVQSGVYRFAVSHP
jgi:alpha-L-rhamnosidase